MIPLKKDITFIRSLQQKKYRHESGLFLVEGKKMVEEALASSFKIHSTYSTDPDFAAIDNKFVKVSSQEMDRMSALSTPSDYLAVLYQIEPRKELEPGKTALFLDGISDPGNMGTIIRSAEWFGVKEIYCSADCVDIYNSKVVQATMGSIFRTHVTYVDAPNLLEQLVPKGYIFCGADMKGESLFEFNFPEKSIIVIGSESNGIRDEMRKGIQQYFTIPAMGEAESLNAAVATSVVLSELMRRRL